MRGHMLAIDTATSQATLAIGDAAGIRLDGRDWPAGHSHAETLLPILRDLLAGMGLTPRDLAGVIVGTGPGGFTGLRVGLATAKTLAHGLGIPIFGVGTAEALAAAALGTSTRAAVVVMPAGPADCYLVEAPGPPRLIAPADRATAIAEAVAGGAILVVVDLDHDDLPEAALELGRQALAGLGAALLAAGARALAAGRADDPATLVPTYVSLPRGVAAAGGEVAWSPDLR